MRQASRQIFTVFLFRNFVFSIIIFLFRKVSNMTTSNFVWAKMKMYSSWPGKICESLPDHITAPKNIGDRALVYFYGTHNL